MGLIKKNRNSILVRKNKKHHRNSILVLEMMRWGKRKKDALFTGYFPGHPIHYGNGNKSWVLFNNGKRIERFYNDSLIYKQGRMQTRSYNMSYAAFPIQILMESSVLVIRNGCCVLALNFPKAFYCYPEYYNIFITTYYNILQHVAILDVYTLNFVYLLQKQIPDYIQIS